MVDMSNPYLYVLKKIMQLSGKVITLLFIIKILILIFFGIGNVQYFTNESMVFIIRSGLTIDSLIILAGTLNIPWCFFKWKRKLYIVLDIFRTFFYMVFSFITIFSGLFILAVITG